MGSKNWDTFFWIEGDSNRIISNARGKKGMIKCQNQAIIKQVNKTVGGNYLGFNDINRKGKRQGKVLYSLTTTMPSYLLNSHFACENY